MGVLLLRQTDHLSRTLQSPKLLAAEGNAIAQDVIKVLCKDKSDQSFGLFWDKVVLKKEQLQADEPKLPRKRRLPVRFGPGDPSNAHFPSTPKDNCRTVYFAAFDATIESIRTRFNQEDFRRYRNLQELMLKAVSGKPLDEEFEERICMEMKSMNFN